MKPYRGMSASIALLVGSLAVSGDDCIAERGTLGCCEEVQHRCGRGHHRLG
jgi:hypothetical protein